MLILYQPPRATVLPTVSHWKTVAPRIWIGYTMPDLLHEVTYLEVNLSFVVAGAASVSCGCW